MPLDEAKAKAQDILEKLKPFCDRIEIAGSIRRGCETVGDIEIVCTPTKVLVAFFDTGHPNDWSTNEPFRWELNTIAPTVVRGTVDGHYTQRLLRDQTKLDLFMPRPADFGRIFAIRTGSKEFSCRLALRWTQMGFTGIGGYLTRAGESCKLRGQWIEKGEVVAFKTEKAFFDFLGIDYVEPRARSV